MKVPDRVLGAGKVNMLICPGANIDFHPEKPTIFDVKIVEPGMLEEA